MDGVRRLVRALSSSAREQAPKAAVSGAQLFVLRQIAAAPGLGVGELAARTLARQSAVSEVVARLAARGLVARAKSSDDARHAVLTLTAAGRRTISGVQPTAQERLAAGLASLPRARRTALADGLERWLAASGFADLTPTMFFEERGSSHGARTRAGARPPRPRGKVGVRAATPRRGRARA
jgi:DNA-binding MarR family transcriptional regulator